MESAFSLDGDAIKTATALVYKSKTNREILRVLFHVNDKTFFKYNVNSVQRKKESGNFQHADNSEFIELLCNSTTWDVSRVKTFSNYIQLTIQINIASDESRRVYMNLKCNPM